MNVAEDRAGCDRSTTAAPRAASADEWRAMTPAQRQSFLEEVNATLTEQIRLTPESRAHGWAKKAAIDRLGQHFSRVGRRIYLADELAVHYPGEPVFVPDILAVLDVEDPGEADQRLAWVVVEEGRGLDLVLEILFRGDRHKDLVLNVERYARLGIGEYFVYDRQRQLLEGWRLPQPSATAYRKLWPRFGRLTSSVLGLDMTVIGGRLRFFSGAAELPGTGELVEQLGQMVDELEAGRVQVEQERAQAEQERAQGLEALRASVVRILEARGLTVPDDLRLRLDAQSDPGVLGRWVVLAATMADASLILEHERG